MFTQLPIVGLGGLGGSGTRLPAQILAAAGVHMGPCQNSSADDLYFTALLKHPHLVNAKNQSELSEHINLYFKLRAGHRLSIAEFFKVRNAFKSLQHPRLKTPSWFNCLFDAPKQLPWGFKEPNAHFFIESLFNHIPHFKYLHILRNGRYMANSQNTAQLINFGFLYPHLESLTNPIDRQFAFWFEANSAAIKRCENGFKSRCLVMKYEDFIHQPEESIKKMLAFCELTAPLQPLLGLIRQSQSNHNKGFAPNAEQMAQLNALGYE